MARTFTNTAIGDDLISRCETGLALIERSQVVSALKCAVRGHSLPPGDIGCPWNVPAA